MDCLNQPVHGTLEQTCLREAKARENERIQDATRSQQAHTPGEKLYETQDQQQEGEDDAQHHMREDETGAIGNRGQPSKKLCPYSTKHTSDQEGRAASGQ